MTATDVQAAVAPVDAASGELRIAVIGVGTMGADHVTRLHRRVSGARVTVVNDAIADKAGAVAATVPGCRVVADPLAAISDPEVDAVVLASPDRFHEAQVLACIERGIPVLCEKPLTLEATSSLDVVRAEDAYTARTGRRLVQVGFMRRFDPEYVQLRALIASGAIGEPLLVHCVHRNATTAPDCTSESMITGSVVHEIDAARFLLDEEVAAVTVLRPKATRHAGPGRSDPLLVLLEMASGRIVDIECFVSTGVAYEVRAEVVAEDGSVTIGLDTGLVQASRGPAGAVRGTVVPAGFRERFAQAYDAEMQRWVDGVRHGTTDGPGAWDGYAAQAVCSAGVEALATGGRTEVRLADR